MKTGKTLSLIAALVGFLAGCIVMYFILLGVAASKKPLAANPHVTTKPVQTHVSPQSPQIQSRSAEITPQSASLGSSLRGGEARQTLSEIKRSKVASVDVQFFAENKFGVSDGKLSQQFIDFFELTPTESATLSDLIQERKAELWKAAKSQTQMSRTETGGVVLKIPPFSEGPDIYAQVMDGFGAVLGEQRYNDLILFNKKGAGGQIEAFFNEFGAESRTVTIEKSTGDRYKIVERVVGKPGTVSSGNSYTGDLDEIKKRTPQYVEFLTAQ